MSNNKRSVLAPIIYSDLFSFPLTLSEVNRFSTEKHTVAACHRILASLYPVVSVRNGYYYLQGREDILRKREIGKRYAAEKYSAALKIARILRKIPTVKYIGLSGTVAAGSAKKTDDIDFFIITKKQTLFLTRFILLIILHVMGKRRKRSDSIGQDRCCLNMFMDEASLQFSKDRRDIYTAREIAQMIPLYEKDGMQRVFFRKNAWLKTFLPNVTPRQVVFRDGKRKSGMQRSIEWLLSRRFPETLLKSIQLLVIRKHLTSETVSGVFLAFHTNDFHLKTINKYEEKIRLFEAKLQYNTRTTIRVRHRIDKPKNIYYTA